LHASTSQCLSEMSSNLDVLFPAVGILRFTITGSDCIRQLQTQQKVSGTMETNRHTVTSTLESQMEVVFASACRQMVSGKTQANRFPMDTSAKCRLVR